MQRETVGQTILTASILCIVCSIIVSTTAVELRPVQEKNKVQEMKKNILEVSGLYNESLPIEENMKTFEDRVEIKIVDLSEGEYLPDADVSEFDQKKASKDPELSIKVPATEDIASLKTREKNSFVYLIRSSDGKIDQVVLPIRGYGLWSTMYGFISLEEDYKTIKGITFYEHGETPGLGGEIENPAWKRQWEGKLAFDSNGEVSIRVIKGSVSPSTEESEFKVDGLSGATITSRGVTNMLQYWLGDNGFGPFLEHLRSGEKT